MAWVVWIGLGMMLACVAGVVVQLRYGKDRLRK